MKYEDFTSELDDFREALQDRYSGAGRDIYFSLNGKMIKFKDLDIEHDEHPGILVRFE